MSKAFASKSNIIFRHLQLIHRTTSTGSYPRKQRQSLFCISSRFIFTGTNITASSLFLEGGEHRNYQHQHHNQRQTEQWNQKQEQKRWMGHTVRLIALEDLPHGKAYKGDVVRVKAGYARNYLIPQKLALYATPQNFDRVGMIDPDIEERSQKQQSKGSSSNATTTAAAAADDQYLKDADVLKKYLKNKVLQIWRRVDPNSTDVLHPGVVTSENLRQKLSKQLKIDLDETESIHIFRDDTKYDSSSYNQSSSPSSSAAAGSATITTTNPLNFTEFDEGQIQTMVDEFLPATEKCSIRINRLGDYLAVIGLGGGYNIPLRFLVRQRAP